MVVLSNREKLSDLRAALSSVYEPNLDDSAFDIIGFDACLMSSLEVTHALDGFARYYAVSEETEPSDGWAYDKWLQSMTDDPTMSPAAICQAIADSYTDCYVAQNINIGFLMAYDTTFAVLDATWYDWADELAAIAEESDSTRYLSIDNLAIKGYAYPLEEVRDAHDFDTQVAIPGGEASVCSDCGYVLTEVGE